jgi:hypothetical protein
VFFGKESEKASEEKPVEKSSGEKPSEQPQPKPKPKIVRFHCGYCGRVGHKDEFYFKRKRKERMAKEWANKDKYHLSNGVLELRVQMPRAKASVRTVPAWGAKSCWRCCWPGYISQTGEGHRSDRCRPGQAAVLVSCSYRCEVWFWRSWF